MVELFLDLYEIIGNDLLASIEKSRRNQRMLLAFNSTFIALIPKVDSLKSLDDFQPISFCNVIYKVVAKLIVNRMKPILSKAISNEQFTFLGSGKIHEAIGMEREGLHSIKIQNLKGVILKIDLSKSYNRVN